MAVKSHHLTGPFEIMRGVIGRYPDEDEEYVFEYDEVDKRRFHMLGVRRPLEIEFLVGGETTYKTVLQPWTGMAKARCDTVIERQPTDDAPRAETQIAADSIGDERQ